MCEFCKKVRDSNESLIWDEDKNGELRGYVEIRYKHDRFELWSGNCFREINYCPICGRKLTGKENKVNDTITKENIRLKKELDTFINCLLPRATIQAGEEIKKGNYSLVTIVTNGERREQKELLDKIEKLNDRHQSDCITINQLNVTIDVLVDKLARLREVHGL